MSDLVTHDNYKNIRQTDRGSFHLHSFTLSAFSQSSERASSRLRRFPRNHISAFVCESQKSRPRRLHPEPDLRLPLTGNRKQIMSPRCVTNKEEQ